MTRRGGIVLAVAVVSGFIASNLWYEIARRLFDPMSPMVAVIASLVGAVIFGVTVVASYTWTVNGPFVFRRNRSHRAPPQPSLS
jgi:hypothetical protein